VAPQWTLYAVLRVLRQNWWVLLLACTSVATGAGFYSLGQTKIYRANTTLQIDPAPPKPLGADVQSVVDLGTGTGSAATTQEYYQTQYDILASRALAIKTLERLGLKKDGHFALNLPKAAELPAEWHTQVAPEGASIEAMQERLKVRPLHQSRLVQVSFDDADPERAKQVVRTLTEEYIDQNVDSALASTQVAAAWLDEQLTKLKSELNDNELALHDYKKDKRILSVSMDDQSNMLRDEMKQLNSALTKVRAELEELKSRNEQLASITLETPTELPTHELLESPVLTSLRERFISATQTLGALRRTGKGERHPDVKAAAYSVELSRKALLEEISNIREALRRDVEAKKQEAQGLASLFARAQNRALELNRLGLEYQRLERAKDNTEKVYSIVLERSKESDLTRYMRFNNIRVIDQTYTSRDPVSPRVPLNIGVGALLGLMLGLAAAFGRNALDRTFQYARDVEEQLKLPLLAGLPLASGNGLDRPMRRRKLNGDELVVFLKPDSAAAEAARALRTNLLFASPGSPQKSLVVTSANPFEGKTTVACWIATAMAQAGKRVLLVDGDLRRPRLHKIFQRSNAAGVSSLVNGNQRLGDLDCSTVVDNLDVLPAGPAVDNPAELLQSEAFEVLLGDLTTKYDRVVIDSPPVNAVTDATVLSTRADGTLLVIRTASTTRDAAQHSARTLRDVTDNLLGVVLNAVNQRQMGYGYGYHRYYGDAAARQDSA
jgi:capsular exopolysaccharide synthesis family protein